MAYIQEEIELPPTSWKDPLKRPNFLCPRCQHSEYRHYEEPGQTWAMIGESRRGTNHRRTEKDLLYCTALRFFVDPRFNDHIIVAKCKGYQLKPEKR